MENLNLRKNFNIYCLKIKKFKKFGYPDRKIEDIEDRFTMFFIPKVNGSKQEHPFKRIDWSMKTFPGCHLESSTTSVFQYVTVVSVVNATLNVHFSDGPLSFQSFLRFTAMTEKKKKKKKKKKKEKEPSPGWF